MPLEIKEREVFQSGMNRVDDSFGGHKCSEHHMEGCFLEKEHFWQKKVALIEGANIILNVCRRARKSVSVEVLKLLKIFNLKSTDYCKE